MTTRHAVWPPGTPSWVDYGAVLGSAFEPVPALDDDAASLAQAAGATERLAARDTGYGRIAALQDLWGARFALLEAAW